MDVTLLYFDGCPHWQVAEQHLQTLVGEGAGLSITRQTVETPEEAERTRFRGSPSILVDGVDPFADDDDPVGLSCRVYQTPAGPAGSPTLGQLRDVFASVEQRTITRRRQIGPIGTAVRVIVGIGLLAIGFTSSPSVVELVGGFVLLPAAEMTLLLILRPGERPPFHIYGAVGYAINFGIGALLFILWTTPAMLFYGASILLAVAKGYAGCEILALSNLVRRRDDQLACAVFSPIDGLEHSD